MAKPTPGTLCPDGCGGTLEPREFPLDGDNPRRGMRWFAMCSGSRRIVPVHRTLNYGGRRVQRTVDFRRREVTCTWVDPDLVKFRDRREQTERSKMQGNIGRARANEAARRAGRQPPTRNPSRG